MVMVAAVVDFLFLFFFMGFDFGTGIDCGGGGNFFFFFVGVILVVMDWFLWLIFGGRWMCGFIGERQKREERKEIRVNCLY